MQLERPGVLSKIMSENRLFFRSDGDAGGVRFYGYPQVLWFHFLLHPDVASESEHLFVLSNEDAALSFGSDDEIDAINDRINSVDKFCRSTQMTSS